MQSLNNATDLVGKRFLVVGTGGGPSGARMVGPVRQSQALGAKIILLDTADSAVSAYADVMIDADVTSLSACKVALDQFLSNETVDGIVTFVEERSVIVAQLSEAYGLRSHSVAGAQAARDKHLMRKVLSDNSLPTPAFGFVTTRQAAEELACNFPFPAFLKISDGGGSVGSRRIETAEDIGVTFDVVAREVEEKVPHDILRSILASYDSDKPNFLIEEYLAPAQRFSGSELGRVTIELLVQNGVIRFFAMADGTNLSRDDHRYATITFPSALPQEDIRAFKDLASAVVELFGLENGPVILDAVMTDRGPQLYEINARIDSSNMVPLVEKCWGVDLVIETLKIAAGIPLNLDEEIEPTSVVSIHFILSPEAGIISEATFPAVDNSSTFIKPLKRVGDKVSGPEAAYDCIATIVISGENRRSVDMQRKQILSEAVIDVSPIGG